MEPEIIGEFIVRVSRDVKQINEQIEGMRDLSYSKMIQNGNNELLAKINELITEFFPDYSRNVSNHKNDNHDEHGVDLKVEEPAYEQISKILASSRKSSKNSKSKSKISISRGRESRESSENYSRKSNTQNISNNLDSKEVRKSRSREDSKSPPLPPPIKSSKVLDRRRSNYSNNNGSANGFNEEKPQFSKIAKKLNSKRNSKTDLTDKNDSSISRRSNYSSSRHSIELRNSIEATPRFNKCNSPSLYFDKKSEKSPIRISSRRSSRISS